MPTLSYSVAVSGGGIAIQPAAISRSADGLISHEVAIPAPKAISSWVKTDSDTAAGNLPGGHGYSTGKFDVYWTGGRRYNVDGTVTVNALALDGGTGDNFPASADLTVVACPRTTINTFIDGDVVSLVAFMMKLADPAATSRGSLLLADSSAVTVGHLDVVANQPAVIDATGGSSIAAITGNPIEKIYASTSDTNGATLQVVGVQDSTP